MAKRPCGRYRARMLSLHLPPTLGAWLGRLTRQPSGAHSARTVDQADTVMHWPPTPRRALATAERHAHRCLAKALALEHSKGYLLAHVPLYKLVRVPLQHSYREWLSRTGLLTVDFALCDEQGYTRSIVLLPVTDNEPRQARLRERLMRVLGATDLSVTQWDPAWQNDDDGGARLHSLLFPRSLGPGYYADAPKDP